ncbi:hypothetical protein Q6247_27055, partial [Klebsiella pneumoniae]
NGHACLFMDELTPLGALDRVRGKPILQYEKVGLKSQSCKNNSKITIKLKSRGMNAKAPYIYP